MLTNHILHYVLGIAALAPVILAALGDPCDGSAGSGVCNNIANCNEGMPTLALLPYFPLNLPVSTLIDPQASPLRALARMIHQAYYAALRISVHMSPCQEIAMMSTSTRAKMGTTFEVNVQAAT